MMLHLGGGKQIIAYNICLKCTKFLLNIIARENVIYGGGKQAGSCPSQEGDWKGDPGAQVLILQLLDWNTGYSSEMMLWKSTQVGSHTMGTVL